MTSSRDRNTEHQDAGQRRKQAQKSANEATGPASGVAGEAASLAEGLGGDFSEATFQRHATLLGDPRMSQPANARQRAQMVRQLQRDYGNQYVQRVVERVSRGKISADQSDPPINRVNTSIEAYEGSTTQIERLGSIDDRRVPTGSVASFPIPENYADIASGGLGQPIQRFLDPNSVRFQHIPPYRAGVLLLQGHNQRALELTRQLHAAGRVSIDLRRNLDILQGTQQTYGPEEVETLEGVSEAITERIARGGQRGQALKNAIDEYTQALPLARGKVERVLEAQHHVAAATEEVEAAVLEGERIQAERLEQATQAEISEIEQRQQQAREISDVAVDGAIDLLTGNWKGFLERAGRYVAKEVVGSIVEGTFESELDAATRRLQKVRMRIREIVDEAARRRINAARNTLQARTARLEAETEELPSLARRAELAHEQLYAILSDIGGPGQEAADVIDQRLSVGDTAQEATRQVSQYASLLRGMRQPADRLKADYDAYAEIVQNNMYNQDQRLIDEAVFRANSNRDSAESIIEWIDEELEGLPAISEYLTNGEYSESLTTGIETVLHEASLASINAR